MTPRSPKHFFRLSAICLLFAAPVVAGVFSHVRDVRAQIAAIDQESAGLRCSLAADDLLTGLQLFRLEPRRPPAAIQVALTDLGSPGCAAFTAGPRASRSAIARAEARLTALPARDASERASMQLGSAVLLMMLDLEDASGLTYDTNVEAVNLGDGITARIPDATERLEQAAEALELASATNGVSREEIIEIAKLVGQSRTLTSMADDDFEGSLNTLPQLRAELAPPRAAADHADERLTQAIDRAAAAGGIRAHELDALRSASIAAGRQLMGTSAETLQISFDARSAVLRREEGEAVAAGIVTIALGCGIVILLWRELRRRDESELLRVRERAEILETQLARHNAERALRTTKQLFRAVFEGSNVGMATLDGTGERIEANVALRTMMGGDLEPVRLQAREMLERAVRGDHFSGRAEHGFLRSDGQTLWTELSLSVVRDEPGDPVSAIILVHDVTEHKQLNARLDHETLHDSLTALPNRVHFVRRLAAAIAAGDPFAVVFIDLDGFKTVNDTHGHHAGDDVLRLTAQRLAATVRPTDFVARLHGDEFAVMIGDVRADPTGSEIDDIVGRIHAALDLRIDAAVPAIRITASIGYVRDGTSYDDPEALLRAADDTMYRSKRDGRGRVTAHEPAGGDRRRIA